MKFPDAYTTGRFLRTGLGTSLVILLCGAITAVIALASYYSHESQLHLDSAQAAEQFMSTVEADWPSNRVTTLYALRHMSSAYAETGENNPAKLKQLERLESWLLRSQTAGDELLFLAEVRRSGSIASAGLWFSSWSRITVSVLIASLFGAAFVGMMMSILKGIDPRLRPPPSTC